MLHFEKQETLLEKNENEYSLTRWLPCHPYSGDSKSSHQATSPVFGWEQEFSSGRFPGGLTGISL